MTVKLDRTLAALADPTRRKVVDELKRGPQRAGELAVRARMSAPAMSRHLRVLRSSGIVAVERAGDDARARVYYLRREPLEALERWLGEFWDDQLAAFKRHVER